jgi:hypothetical protein
MKQFVILVVIAGCGSGVHDQPGGSIDWSGPSMSLVADSLTLLVDSVTFHGSTDQFSLKTGQGDELDATWAEAGSMPRIHLGFQQGSGSWFITDARAYRLDQTDWIEQTGPFYTTPAAQAYDGNLDFVIDDNGHHAEIHFVDVRLAPLGIP